MSSLVNFRGKDGLTFDVYCGITTDMTYIIDRVIGRTMEKIEILGLAKTQEEAIKNAVKQDIWAMNGELHELFSVFLDGESREKLNEQTLPPSGATVTV